MEKLSQLYVILSLLLVTLLITGCTGTPAESTLQNASNDGLNSSDNTDCVALGNCPANDESIFGSISKNLNRETKPFGYYVSPKDPRAGIILIHEWWGLNDNIKLMADHLASKGYAVVAVDLYGGKVAQNSSEAREYRTAYNQTQGITVMNDANTYLRNKGVSKMASMGWCFGGGESLAYSLSGVKLDATVIYYGTLTTKDLSKITWPVLGIFGDKDQVISVESVESFDKALDNLSITNEIYMYPNVGHAFANPSNAGFAPQPAKDAWNKTLVFLEKSLN